MSNERVKLDRELKEIWSEEDGSSIPLELQQSLKELGEVEAPIPLKVKLLSIPETHSASKWGLLFSRGLPLVVPALVLILVAVFLPTSPRSTQMDASRNLAMSENEELLSGMSDDFGDDSFEIFDDELLFLEEVL